MGVGCVWMGAVWVLGGCYVGTVWVLDECYVGSVWVLWVCVGVGGCVGVGVRVCV